MHLYIHIPFCKQKCSYCDFNSGFYDINTQNRYISSLISELQYLKQKNALSQLKTIYIGGGTPSALNNSDLVTLLSYIQTNLINNNLEEYTIECNPESVNDTFVKTIKYHSINRISMGVQSTDEKTLKFLHRIHNKTDVENAVNLFNKYKIDNYNLDLIYTIPNQKINILQKSLDDIISYGPKHISCYSLIFEEGTYLFHLLEKGLLEEVSDEEFVSQYRFIIEYLKNNGYYQYEISNFAKKNYEAIHNTAYWNNADYIGVGVSGYSKQQNIRYSNIYDVNEYIKCYSDNKEVEMSKTNDCKNLLFSYTPSTDFDNIDILDDKDIFNEYIMLGLRQNNGISLARIEDFFNNEHLTAYKLIFFEALNHLLNKSLINIQNDNITLSQSGREISNSIYVELMI